MQEEARLLNVGRAAAYLGVSAASLRKWSNDGLVPVYRTPGGQRRFAISDLDEFMQSMREPGRVPVPRLGRGASVIGS
ncbi:MAG: MerR family transcriptional regulator [Solirubrobacterales bacterium]